MVHRTSERASEVIGHPAAPMRVQRKRTRGWCMPPNTISVARPGSGEIRSISRRPIIAGNALALGCRGDAKGRREAAVKAFEQWVDDPRGRVKEMDFGLVMEGAGGKVQLGPRAHAGAAPSHQEIREALRGNISPASAHLISHAMPTCCCGLPMKCRAKIRK